MRDRELYAKILGVREPWMVTDVVLDRAVGEVRVLVGYAGDARVPCPQCGAACSRFDHRSRRFRHLDTCQYRTILEVEIPRADCPEHGVHQVGVPWAEPGSRFTALFEALAIDWLREASIKAVAEQMHLTWREVDGIQRRAVKRGLERRSRDAPTRIAIDETSFQKRHEYVTTLIDMDGPHVVDVADGHSSESLEALLQRLTPEELAAIQVVAMDMSAAFLKAVRERIPDADDKIAFDRFHVAQHLNDAVNEVRKRENQALLAEDNRALVGTRYLWLKRRGVPAPRSRCEFRRLTRGMLKTARA